MKFDVGRVEKVEGKGENAGFKQLLLFPYCFQKASSQGHQNLDPVVNFSFQEITGY